MQNRFGEVEEGLYKINVDESPKNHTKDRNIKCECRTTKVSRLVDFVINLALHIVSVDQIFRSVRNFIFKNLIIILRK